MKNDPGSLRNIVQRWRKADPDVGEVLSEALLDLVCPDFNGIETGDIVYAATTAIEVTPSTSPKVATCINRAITEADVQQKPNVRVDELRKALLATGR